MDFSFFFRRFFNDSPHRSPNSFFEDSDFESNRDTDDMVGDSFGVFNKPDDMLQHMENMFEKMFSSVNIGFPRFGENMLPGFEEQVPEQNPRSLMLKKPEEQISCMKQQEESNFTPNIDCRREQDKLKMFSFSKFSSVKTIRLSDGTIEEEHTIVDSDGKKTTKVRRSIGDTAHEIITKSDNAGIKEKEENFVNMDENEVADFEKKWEKFKNKSGPETEASVQNIPDSSPMYLYFFKKFFGSSQKDQLKWC